MQHEKAASQKGLEEKPLLQGIGQLEPKGPKARHMLLAPPEIAPERVLLRETDSSYFLAWTFSWDLFEQEDRQEILSAIVVSAVRGGRSGTSLIGRAHRSASRRGPLAMLSSVGVLRLAAWQPFMERARSWE
jgi:hypothetical protein